MADFQLSNDQINQLTLQVAQAIGVADVPASLDGVSQNTINGWKQEIAAQAKAPQSLPLTPGLLAGAYKTTFGMISEEIPGFPADPSGPPPSPPVAPIQVPIDGVDKSAWVFIKSVVSINANTQAPQDIAARQYTAIQWRLRTGTDIGNGQGPGIVSQMSNGIALSVMNAIINGSTDPEFPRAAGVIPGINEIGKKDASVVIDGFFKGDAAGWVGNALFHYFGTDLFFKDGLLPDGAHRDPAGGPDNGPDPNGTYDIFSSMYAMQQALKGLSTADLISNFLADSRASVEANNAIGITATDSLMQNLSNELDREIKGRYYENWSGLFNTFWNPSALDNPLVRPAPQVVVGKLNQADTIDLTHPDAQQGIPNVVDRSLIVRMGNKDDTVKIGPLPIQAIVDGGDGVDSLDLSAVDFKLRVESKPQIGGNEAISISSRGSSQFGAVGAGAGSVYAYNFESLTLGNKGNTVKLRGDDVPHLQRLNPGDGNNVIDSSVANLRISLGNGNNLLLHAGAGSVVASGRSDNIFEVSNQVLLTGVKHTDTVMLGSEELTGGIQYKGSESPWALGIDGTRYGFDPQGDLVIKDAFGDVMGIANGVSGPGHFDDDSAGLYVAQVSLTFSRIMDLKEVSPAWQSNQFAYVNAFAKAYGEHVVYAGVDPIVLDLSGNGLHLTDLSSAAPRFDINGDGFAVRTGWVEPSTGILVLDKNGNGTIDNVGEMFGGPGLNGYAALATYDTNADGVIDANDAVFSQLQVWIDGNGNGVTNPGELKSLADLGITAISLDAQTQTDSFVAGNQVLETGTFTKSDGTTGLAADVALHVNNYDTQFLGDTSVTAAAAGLPEQKGYGTLTDLSVAISHDPTGALAGVIAQTLPTLNAIDLPTLLERVTPILTAWAAAVQVINPDGTLSSPAPSGHADLPILMSTTANGTGVANFAYHVSDSQGSYFKLASGTPVLDADGHAIARPTLEQVLAQSSTTGQWTTFSGADLDFMERYLGDTLPVGGAPQNPGAALAALGPVITQMVQTLNEIAVSIAMQGPLASYFAGLAYDVTTNSFHATTTDQLAPMYEAVFRNAPADAAGASQWLAQWKPILDVVLGDFAREQGLEVTYGYRFVNVVAAYEAVGLPLDIKTAASALGIPSDLIFAGSTTLDGSAINDADLFYLSGGNQTAIGGAGPDNYIVGGTIGHDTIVDHQGAGNDNPNTVRFASVKSTDVTASRVGLDLVLKVKGTDEQITVENQFTGARTGLFGGNLNDVWGVAQITFADGVVWERPDIAFAVAPNTDGVNGTLLGTGAMDVLDGGRGNHFMSGGDGGDVYLYDRGDGADTILENRTDALAATQNYVSFGPGLSEDDVVFTRNGASGDLLIQIKDDPSDSLLVQGQFAATYTGIFGTEYFDQVQNFRFSDGTILTWQDVQDQIIAQEEATPGAAIYGFASGDTIDPGIGGNRYMSGGNGEHTYVFGMGYGNDTIEVNSSNILSGSVDTVLFNPDVDPSDVQVIRNGGSGDFTLALSDGSTLTIIGQFDRVSTFDIWWDRVANFQFQDASNTLWTYQDIEKKVIQYEIANSHQVYGTPNPDVLDPGPGAGGYYLQGGYGGDTYVFGEGYGHDTIFTAHYPLPAADTVLFNADVDPSTVRFSRGADPGTLAIILADGSELDVTSQFGGGQLSDFYTIGNFQFQDADHTTLSAVDVAKKVIQDEITNGNHTVFGTQYSDTIDTGPGAGGYFLSGGNGGDTYVFGEGYGHDTIYAGHYPYWSADTLLFNSDVDPSTVRFERGANPADLAITLADGSEIDVQGQFGTGYAGTINQLANFQFQDANHTLLNLGQIEDIIFATEQATPGAIVYGEHAGQTLDGYGGNNTLVGYGGGNTFDFGLGYGHELVRSSGNGSDVVQLGAGITPDMIEVSRPADPLSGFYSPSRDLVLQVSGTDDVLTVHHEFPDAGNPSPVGEVRFADGTVWDAATLAGMASAPQTIVGSDGNDTLIGNASDKILVGQGPNTVAYYGVDNAQIVLANHVAYIDGASPYGGDTITGISTAIVAGHNDTLSGTGDGNSTLIATGVDDTLIAGYYGGGDTLIGTDGVGAVADIIWTNSNMTIDLGAGRSYVNGVAHDVLIGIKAASADRSGTTLIGGAGNDTLMSKGTGNTLIGGVGTDTLVSTGTGNTLIGSAGTDTLITSGAGDTLIAGAGANSLASTGHSNTLIGGSGSSTLSDSGTGDTMIGTAAGDTLIGTDATGLTVHYGAANLLVDLGAGVARIGDSTSADTLIGITTLDVNGSNDTLIGGSDGDLINSFGYGNTLVAGSGSETLAAHGSGNTLVGGNGDDTFLYQSYDGDLEIKVSPQTSWDPHTHTLKFVDFNQSDMSFAQVGDSLVITCLHFGGTITIDNQYLDGQGLQRIEFADGTALNSADIATLVQVVGSGQTRSISGDQLSITVEDAAHLTVTGSSNTVTVTGDSSTVVAVGDSSSVSLLASEDTASIEGDGSTGFVAGPNANIAITGDGGNLTIRGDGAIATIRGDSGNIASWGNAVQATVTGSYANVVSFGDGVVATVNGDSGSITSFGNAARLTLNGSYGTLHSFTNGASLALNGDFGSISAFGADLTVQLEGNHGRISADGADGQFLLQGNNGYVNVFGLNAHIELDGNNAQAHAGDDEANVVVRGDNGFIITFGNDDNIALNGNAGTVLSFGDGGTVVVTGNGNAVSFGSDQVVASWGYTNTLNFQGSDSTARVADNSGDTVVYSASDGNFDVQDIVGGAFGGSPIGNVLQLSDLNLSDVVLSRSGSALEISVVSTGAVISVEGEFTAGDNPIQQIQFADGSTLTSSQMLASTPLVVSGDGVTATIDLAGDSATLAGANDSLRAAGDAESVTVTGTADLVVLAGAQDTLTVAGDSASVVDNGSGNTVVLSGDNAVGQFFGTDGTITSTGQGNYLILTGTQTVTVTGENTGINNMGTDIAITLSAAGDSMSMNGSDNTTTVTCDHIAVADFGTEDVTVLSGNFDNASLQGVNGTIVSTGHDNTITLSGDSQSVTVSGENTYVSNGGTGLTVSLSAAGDSIDLTAGASGNTTTLATDGGSVRDFGTGNTTTMSGEHQVGQFYGTNGTIVSTGQGNYIDLTGTQTVTVTGADTGINNMGVGMDITLSAAGDNMSMNGSADTTTATGDHITVADFGTNDVTTLSGNFDNANLQGTNGTIVSTGHDNNITLSGDSQSVTVTGENTQVVNAGGGLSITLCASGDAIDLTTDSVGNTTTLGGDGLTMRDFGTGNATTLAGDDVVASFYGTGSTVLSTGNHNYLILSGGQNVSVSGSDSGINDLGDGATITLGGAGDYLTLGGSGNSTSITADGVSVHDNAGGNRFAIANGTGVDTLHLAAGQSDVASFGSGIAYDQLWFAQSGQDLVMSVIGRSQTLTVSNWYGGADNHLGELETADGYQIADTGIEQLVQAMAAYTPPAEGQTTLPADLAQALAPTLAANWQHS